jgi:hypothetical protein
VCGGLQSVSFLYVNNIKSVEGLLDNIYELMEEDRETEIIDPLRKNIVSKIMEDVNGLIKNDPYELENLKSIKENYKKKKLNSIEKTGVSIATVNFKEKEKKRVLKVEINWKKLGEVVDKYKQESLKEEDKIEWKWYEDGSFIPFSLKNDLNEYRLVKNKKKKAFFRHSSAFYPFLPQVVVIILRIMEIVFFLLEGVGIVMCVIEYAFIRIITMLFKCCCGCYLDDGEFNKKYLVTKELIQEENNKYTKDVQITNSFIPLENKDDKDYEDDDKTWEFEIKGFSFRQYCRRYGFFRPDAHLISRRYGNFSSSFKYYSQRERIVGMSYNKTLFAQAFDNNGKVDKDFIRDNFTIPKWLLFSDVLFFNGFDEKKNMEKLNSYINMDMDVNKFFSNNVNNTKESSSSSSCFISEYKISGNLHQNQKWKMTENIDLTDTRSTLPKFFGKNQVLLFLDEIIHDLEADVTLSQEQRDVFKFYLLYYHWGFRRALSVLGNSSIISVVLLLAMWMIFPNLSSSFANKIFNSSSVGYELVSAIIIFVVIYVSIVIIYTVIFIIIVCVDGVKIKKMESELL